MVETLKEAASSLRAALSDAGRGLVEREALVEVIALAAVAGEHVLVIGPPGTAKSEAVRRVARALGGSYFEYLLGRFTEPSELFGPIDLRRLREGVVETATSGMLPEAEIAFLDEVFQGSTAILNTLLGTLNERCFRRGHTVMPVPLRVCVGAANTLPDDPSLAAFADRFLVRAFVQPIADPRLEELLQGGWALSSSQGHRASVSDIDALAAAARVADPEPIRGRLAHVLRLLRAAGVTLSDRRAVKVQRLVAAAAVMAGRQRPGAEDLWPVVLAVPTAEEQTVARECLRDVLAASENASLPHVTEAASRGPAARAARIASQGNELLEQRPGDPSPDVMEVWRLRLEGVAREIDAGFSADQLPEPLAGVRARIVAALASRAGDA